MRWSVIWMPVVLKMITELARLMAIRWEAAGEMEVGGERREQSGWGRRKPGNGRWRTGDGRRACGRNGV
ncbi:hypothetical protein CDL15_Pgr017806 [Punica granatum]|nr:hypothetical protein CDL15_Pgr017806 [Punica granatum]